MTEFVVCPECQKEWPAGCEQAASVELFRECVACRFWPFGNGSQSGTDDDLRAICIKAHGPEYEYKSPNEIILDFERKWSSAPEAAHD